MLLPLTDNGGPTETHALDAGSVAIDAGDPSDNRTDQRTAGVFNGRRDVGAFEFMGTLSSEDIADENLVVIYPNPVTSGNLNINLQDLNSTDVEISIFEMTRGNQYTNQAILQLVSRGLIYRVNSTDVQLKLI